MLVLKDVFYFVRVVDHGGYTAAAQVLRLRKSTLSHRVQALENHLGVHVLNGTPRQLSLTEMGSEFHRHALDLLQNSELAEEVSAATTDLTRMR